MRRLCAEIGEEPVVVVPAPRDDLLDGRDAGRFSSFATFVPPVYSGTFLMETATGAARPRAQLFRQTDAFWHRTLRGRIAGAVEEGAIEASADPDEAARLTMAALGGLSLPTVAGCEPARRPGLPAARARARPPPRGE